MTKAEYIKYHKQACENMMSITQKKNADYCGLGDDPFANFTRVEAMGITDTARGFLVRMSDKLSRITSFVQKGYLEVSDESVQDTLLDLGNYSILLAAYIDDQKKRKIRSGIPTRLSAKPEERDTQFKAPPGYDE